MKLDVYLVTYEAEKRIERRWEDIEEGERKKLAEELTDQFMKRAGFSPALDLKRSDR